MLLLAICVIAALSLLFTLVMRVPKQKQEDIQPLEHVEHVERVKRRLRWSDFIEPKALPISGGSDLILAFAYSSLSGFMSSFTVEIHQSQVAGTFFVVFALMIVAFRPLIGKIFDSYNEHYLYYPGIILFTVGMLHIKPSALWDDGFGGRRYHGRGLWSAPALFSGIGDEASPRTPQRKCDGDLLLTI